MRTSRVFFSILIVCAMLISLFAPAYAAPDPDKSADPGILYGDVDGDGTVSASDARLTLRAALGLEKYEPESRAFFAADVVKDGKLTAADARLILRWALDLEESAGFPSLQDGVYDYEEDDVVTGRAYFSLTPEADGDSIAVSVRLENGVGLQSADFDLIYDPAVLELTSTAEGADAKAAGSLDGVYYFFERGAVQNGTVPCAFCFGDALWSADRFASTASDKPVQINADSFEVLRVVFRSVSGKPVRLCDASLSLRVRQCWGLQVSCRTSYPGWDYQLGDVDGDGNVKLSDVQLTQRAAVGLERFDADSRAFAAADVLGDYRITAADVHIIYRVASYPEEADPSRILPPADLYDYAAGKAAKKDAEFALLGERNGDDLLVTVQLQNCVGLKSADFVVEYASGALEFTGWEIAEKARTLGEVTNNEPIAECSGETAGRVNCAMCFKEPLWGSERFTGIADHSLDAGSLEALTLKFRYLKGADAARGNSVELHMTQSWGVEVTRDAALDAGKAHVHAWKLAEDVAASCLCSGYARYVCSGCGRGRTEPRDVIPHTDSDGNGVCEVCHTDIAAADDAVSLRFVSLEDNVLTLSLTSTIQTLSSYKLTASYDDSILQLLAVADGPGHAAPGYTYDVDDSASGKLVCSGAFANEQGTGRYELMRLRFLVRDADAQSVPFTLTGKSLATYCPKSFTLRLPVVHDWVDNKITLAPTCEDTGESYAICALCGLIDLEDIPATGEHTWDGGSVLRPFTCVKNGEMLYTCLVCGKTRREVIPAPGEHMWNEGVVTIEPACAVPGEKTFTCTVCGARQSEEIPATGVHIWDEGVVTVEPTIDAEGEMTYTCDTCDLKRTEPIPKLPPLLDDKIAKEQDNKIYVRAGVTASDLLALLGKGAKITRTDGAELKADDKIGTGMTLTKADGVKERVIVKGDVSGDGVIAAADARSALRQTVNLDYPKEWEAEAARVTGGEKVSAADARSILRAAVGLEKLDLI